MPSEKVNRGYVQSLFIKHFDCKFYGTTLGTTAHVSLFGMIDFIELYESGNSCYPKSKGKWNNSDMIEFARKMKDEPIPEDIDDYDEWYAIFLEKQLKEGAGRKPKFKEETTTIAFRVPLSKAEEIKVKVKTILKSYLKDKSGK